MAFTVSRVPPFFVVRIALHVKPGAKKTQILEIGDAIELQISAKPQNNEANKCVVEYFSDVLGISKSYLTLSGLKSRNKILEVKIHEDQVKHDVLDMIVPLIKNQI